MIQVLLELKQADRKDRDSTTLVGCIDGMTNFQFWNYLECNTITEGGGREKHFVDCKPNEILSPGPDVSTSVLPIWVFIVLAILAALVIVAVLILIIAIIVISYRFHRYKTERPRDEVQER